MKIQKYCVSLPFTLLSVARHCSTNNLCSDFLNLFFMAHFSLKVLFTLRFFQFASFPWAQVKFCLGQFEFFIISFFNAYWNIKARKINQKYKIVSLSNWLFLFFNTWLLKPTLMRDRQIDVWPSPSANTCFSSLPTPYSSTYTYVNTHHIFFQWTKKELWSWHWTKILSHKIAWHLLLWWTFSLFPEYNSNQWRPHFIQKKETYRSFF